MAGLPVMPCLWGWGSAPERWPGRAGRAGRAGALGGPGKGPLGGSAHPAVPGAGSGSGAGPGSGPGVGGAGWGGTGSGSGRGGDGGTGSGPGAGTGPGPGPGVGPGGPGPGPGVGGTGSGWVMPRGRDGCRTVMSSSHVAPPRPDARRPLRAAYCSPCRSRAYHATRDARTGPHGLSHTAPRGVSSLCCATSRIARRRGRGGGGEADALR